MIINNLYNLLLDDERTLSEAYFITNNKIYLNHEWKIVRNYDDFVETIIENGLPKIISFDHDLGIDKSGYDCAKWLIYYCIDENIKLKSQILIHSMNPTGSVLNYLF